MKMHEPKKVKVGGNTFYIWPFSAFKATNISGDLMAFLLPLVGAIAPFLGGGGTGGGADSLLDVNMDQAAPAITGAFNSVSGDRVEAMLKKLLIVHKNITVDVPDEDDPAVLDEDLANEIFCGEPRDMFILAFEVIRFNYNGFFSKLGARFGGVTEKLLAMVDSLKTTEPST